MKSAFIHVFHDEFIIRLNWLILHIIQGLNWHMFTLWDKLHNCILEEIINIPSHLEKQRRKHATTISVHFQSFMFMLNHIETRK